MLEKLFHLKENSTDAKKELLAGFTTFITMAYIIFVNPQMMSSTGMELGAVFVGTCPVSYTHLTLPTILRV